jgi:hypothetical protein
MATNTSPIFPPVRRDARQVVNTLKRTLNFNDSDIAKFSFANSLPQGAFIISVQAYVVTAFNAGTTNPITVGTNSATFNNLFLSGDINPLTPGFYTNARGLGEVATAAADVAVFGTYVPTGTAPTAGQVVIVITYEGGWLS